MTAALAPTPAGPRSLGPGPAVLAFDVGGTDVKSALVDRSGALRGLRRTSSPAPGADSPQRLLDLLVRLADDLREDHPGIEPDAAGLVVPGIVDAPAGIAVFSSNLGWRDAPLRDLATARLGLPVAFDHDVATGSWAEHRIGGARPFDDAVVLIIGTGVAGTLILDGRLHAGGGYAGEIGHSPLGDWPCPCGARGCLEAVASAGAIARRYRDESGRTPDGAREVLALAASGDAVASRVWDEALDALAMSLAQLTAVLAPQAVVIGGGLSRAGAPLFDELRRRLADRLSFHRLPELVPAELGGDAGILGSALRARALREAS